MSGRRGGGTPARSSAGSASCCAWTKRWPGTHGWCFAAAIRTVDLDTLKGLIRILARRPGPETTADMQYLLRNRALQSHTRRVLDALVICAGPEAKAALLEELGNPRSAVRDQAVDLLMDKVTASDLPVLLAISQHAMVDRRKAGIRLLGAIPAPEARARLFRALAEPEIGRAHV